MDGGAAGRSNADARKVAKELKLYSPAASAFTSLYKYSRPS